jgi:hypothetical protein
MCLNIQLNSIPFKACCSCLLARLERGVSTVSGVAVTSPLLVGSSENLAHSRSYFAKVACSLGPPSITGPGPIDPDLGGGEGHELGAVPAKQT